MYGWPEGRPYMIYGHVCLFFIKSSAFLYKILLFFFFYVFLLPNYDRSLYKEDYAGCLGNVDVLFGHDAPLDANA